MARVNAQYLSASVINLDCRPRCSALDKVYCTCAWPAATECRSATQCETEIVIVQTQRCDKVVFKSTLHRFDKDKKVKSECSLWLQVTAYRGRATQWRPQIWHLKHLMRPQIGNDDRDDDDGDSYEGNPKKTILLVTLHPPHWTWPHTIRSQYLKTNLAWCYLNCMSFGVVLQKRRSLSTKGVWAEWKWSDFLISRN